MGVVWGWQWCGDGRVGVVVGWWWCGGGGGVVMVVWWWCGSGGGVVGVAVGGILASWNLHNIQGLCMLLSH